MRKTTPKRRAVKTKDLTNKTEETALIPLTVCGHQFPVLLDDDGEEHVKVADLCAPSPAEQVARMRLAVCAPEMARLLLSMLADNEAAFQRSDPGGFDSYPVQALLRKAGALP